MVSFVPPCKSPAGAACLPTWSWAENYENQMLVNNLSTTATFSKLTLPPTRLDCEHMMYSKGAVCRVGVVLRDHVACLKSEHWNEEVNHEKMQKHHLHKIPCVCLCSSNVSFRQKWDSFKSCLERTALMCSDSWLWIWLFCCPVFLRIGWNIVIIWGP